ncbi:MAG: hypothetical protein KC443_07535, partial [Anaerolineales bacterium]|nr:hypothetical protein [Anaerolineales bacterium]
MQTVAHNNFITVKTEGGILPAELLQRIADGKVEGLNPTDYHLASSERPSEAINRSWNRLLGVWQAFQNKMERAMLAETGTTMTREWLLTVLQELGYGRLPYQGKLTVSASGGAADYPISHLYDHTPIHLVTFRQPLNSRDDSQAIKRSPHSLLQESLNRSSDHLWGFVSNGLRFRILRDNVSLSRAAYVEFDLEAMFDGELYSDFSLFWLVCHQSRVEIQGSRELAVERGEDDPTPSIPHPTPANCWLEKWSQTAAEQGTRALDALRDGVQEAIAALGRGFLAHKANGALRQQLQSGALSTAVYYRQLLRLVYRLLFLFVAEDRDLLLVGNRELGVGNKADSPTPNSRQMYDAYYSVSRLRRLAATRRGGPHPDLYITLTQLFSLLRQGYSPLGLPGLGGFLFSARATPDLDTAVLANQDLLTAIHALAFTVEGKVRRPVDYKNLGTEELGSVYESLLELHPNLHVPSASFSLDVVSGSERKTTGSYYTPTSLIQSLLDTALEPVVEDRLRQVKEQASREAKEKNLTSAPLHLRTSALEEAILSIRVIDPAAGSGHFLIAAARRLARHLARVRTGDDEPGPEAVRHALRDVVGRCIHGVDINEMAVELCKVALWMETLDPGKPLSFLDANIQCGNSLIGTTPALLARGVPDEAFTPITGDDRAYCSEWKKRNKKEREGQKSLFTGALQPWQQLGNLAAAMRQLGGGDDGTLAGVQSQEADYARLVQSSDYEHSKLWADAWVAAFLWEKKPEHLGGWAQPLTHEIFRKLGQNPYSEKGYWAEIRRLAEAYQFFHWHLAFPQVFTPQDLTGFQNLSGLDGDNDVTGWTGGFDVVLGNPPWDQVQFDDREFFVTSAPDIAGALNMAARKKMLTKLKKDNQALYAEYETAVRQLDGIKHFIHTCGSYPLTSFGRLNLAPLFAELSRHIVSGFGQIGVIVPTGIATDSFNQYFFRDLVDSAVLASLYDFENRNAIFPGVHRSYKFSLLTLTGAARPVQEGAQFVFFAQEAADLRDPERCFTLSAADIALLNPNTRTCPIFRSRRDAELTKSIYRRIPVLLKEGEPEENPWGIKFMLMFMMNTDSYRFRTREQLEEDGWRLTGNQFVRGKQVCLPLYEAKMLHQFDHRWATYEGLETRDVTAVAKNDPTCFVLPRYWVREEEVNGKLKDRWSHEWLLAWRDICRSTDERTLISSFFSKSGCGDTVLLMMPSDDFCEVNPLISSSLDSFVADYAARQKIGGTHLKYHVFKQLPVLPPQTYHQPCLWGVGNTALPTPYSPSPYSAFLLPRILELTYTAYDLRPFAQDCGYDGPPFR